MSQVQSLILEEFVDLSAAMQVVFQKRAEGFWPEISFSQPSFFFARCASTLELHVNGESAPHTLDAYNFASIAAGAKSRILGTSAISDGVFFSPSEHLIQKANKTYSINFNTTAEGESSATILPRTNWLNEIMHRYIYERVVTKQKSNAATEFLEVEILKEIHFRFQEQHIRDKSRFDLDSLAFDSRSPLLRKAMAFMDENLFRDIGIEDLVRRLKVSESTLLREFREHLGQSPNAYLVGRRLEEAMLLLRSQRYSVSQISDIVGYENVSAFSAAFKKKFGLTPVQVVTKDRSDSTPKPIAPPKKAP
jgi:AraC-like DNA-binding protein